VKYLEGVDLPDGLRFTANHEEAVRDAEGIVIAVPSKFYRNVMEQFRAHVSREAMIVSVTKGLDVETQGRMSDVAKEVLGVASVSVLSGPSHAEEVARGVPSAVVIACSDHDAAVRFQAIFNSAAFRVYTSTDVIGVELGGAMKNVIAVAAGISDGIGFGDNTKAALVTRGLAEISRLGSALGAQPGTFAGLSGIGDLIVTCMSRLSRNRGVGEQLGSGKSLEEIMESMEQVAEGVWTCVTAKKLGHDLGVELPITAEVHAVVHEGKDPAKAVQDLLSRDPKPELDS
jgi:glycerol-3-phosphate dehydrogenase (NAD(P)+)